MKKTVGIIGGMGPLATADLFRKIITLTDSENDQDHLRILIDNNTNIPDRTASILHGGTDPVPEILNSARSLISLGAKILCMPCNTAHYFYDVITEKLQPGEDIRFINMLTQTAFESKAQGFKTVGLLATDATVSTGVYDRAFAAQGIEVLRPDKYGQQAVMDIIYNGVKAGKKDIDTAHFIKVMDSLFDAGAEALILGCTELPIAFEMCETGHRVLDPTKILAASVIKAAGGKVKC